MRPDRRDALRLLGLPALAWALGCGRREAPGALFHVPSGALPGNAFAGRWMGDDPARAHRLLEFEAGPPPRADAVRERAADAVVVGAGISGLAAAYLLAREGLSVVVLEQAPAPGGNARAEAWGGIEYAIGAAYFTRPDEGSRLEALYGELGVLEGAVVTPHLLTLRDGRLAHGFWEGAATRAVAAAWKRMYDERYPAIPWTPGTAGWSRAEFEEADRTPFATHLARLGAPADVRTFCEYYCWSAFGGRAAEISTYAALNFLTAEFGDILAHPGGNAFIARRLVEALRRTGARLVTGALVTGVSQDDAGVEVAARIDDDAHVFPGRACVLAVPRFIARHLVVGYPEDRAAIVGAMRWRAYLVANVLLARAPRDHAWYGAFRVDAGLDPRSIGCTDLILADFAAGSATPHCVLTAYRALPYEDGRAELGDDGYERCRNAVRRDLQPWLAALGLADGDVVDINLARWGHPLVLARPGQLASGDLERASAPLGRIVFAHQDRFGVPAIESALDAAFEAGAETNALL